VVRLGATSFAARQARLEQELRVFRVGIEQSYRRRWIVLLARVSRQVRADKFAPGQIQIHIQHIGDNTDSARAHCWRFSRRRARRGRRRCFARYAWQFVGQRVACRRRSRPGTGIGGCCHGLRCGRRPRRRGVLHPGIDVEPQDEEQSDPQENALLFHQPRTEGTGS
jgi:hypothetical protein